MQFALKIKSTYQKFAAMTKSLTKNNTTGGGRGGGAPPPSPACAKRGGGGKGPRQFALISFWHPCICIHYKTAYTVKNDGLK